MDVTPGSQNVVPGSPTAWFRANGVSSFISFPLVSTGGTHYRADFPAPLCVSTPQFYFTAQGDQGANAASPSNAPTTFYSTAVGTITTTTILTQSFETGLPAGWSATGLWHISSTCSPGSICDGTQWAYYGQDGTCTFDTGVTNSGLLTSAPIVLPTVPAGGAVTLNYCSAKISENLSTYDVTTVLVNGTTVIDTAGESASFETRTADLTAFAGQSITLAWKFDTVDNINNNFRGWHVDNVRITATGTTCTDPAQCYANCDASTNPPVLNVADFTCFLQKYASGDPYANCDASTSPPVLNVADFTCFLQKYATGCP